jgi:hypothetical protein
MQVVRHSSFGVAALGWSPPCTASVPMIQRKLLLGAVLAAVSQAQTAAPASVSPMPGNPLLSTPLANETTWQSKMRFHIERAYGPDALIGSLAFAGYLQAIDSPREWGQGSTGYGKRLVSTMAFTGIRNTLALGLDSALHEDPHYYRAGGNGVWRRTKYALRSTLFTRKDSGGETFSAWRFGSAYSAAFIANQWRPDRVNTVALSFQEGSTQLGFDLLGNLGSEFWPDLKKKLGHR